MPLAAKDLQPSKYLKMLVLGPARIGKTRLLATAPMPAYVICSDDESKLDSATSQTTDFEYDLVNDTRGPQLLSQMEIAIRSAQAGVTAGKYKTVIWDTLSTFATYLLAAELMAAGDNAMTAFPSYGRRLISYLGRLIAIPAHIVVLSHDAEHSKELPGQLRKQGEGIVPNIEGGVRTRIAGMFRDTVYLQKKGGGSDERILVCSIKGVWGPGSNTLPGVESVPADLSNFLKLAQEGKPLAKNPATVPAKGPAKK
jgi:hypothetical protein